MGLVRYIQQGETKSAELASILGGMAEDQSRLLRQLANILLFSCWVHLQQAGLLGLPWALVQCLFAVLGAIGIILPAALDEFRF